MSNLVLAKHTRDIFQRLRRGGGLHHGLLHDVARMALCEGHSERSPSVLEDARKER